MHGSGGGGQTERALKESIDESKILPTWERPLGYILPSNRLLCLRYGASSWEKQYYKNKATEGINLLTAQAINQW